MTEETETPEIDEESVETPAADTEDTTSTDSASENNEADETQTPDGENENDQEDPDKDTPFHEHPRWKQREDEWTSRFNDQEKRHQDDLKSLREEFGGARKDNAEQTEIPSWFGGTQEQWDAYRKHEDTRLQEAEDRAVKRLEDKKTKEETLVKEATDYMQSELASIESDKTLNPDGKKISPDKLVKFVIDNDLVDSKGRWNYRAGFKMMQGSVVKPAAPKTDTTQRKNIAGATTSENRGENKPATVKTSEDFKKNRPW